ncbi:MAG: hypothetical protein WDN76_10890 [Alphaproteobacteria bacterium]
MLRVDAGGKALAYVGLTLAGAMVAVWLGEVFGKGRRPSDSGVPPPSRTCKRFATCRQRAHGWLMTLDSLATGAAARIASIEATPDLEAKLREIGFARATKWNC